MSAILALDLGSATGFALLRADGKVESGTQKFTPRAKEGEGIRYVNFRRWLIDLKGSHDITRVAYEKVMGHGPGVQAAHVYGGFIAVLMMFCEHHQIPYDGHHVGTIKKAWTGDGTAKKPDMVKRCEQLGFTPGSHNEADAIALLHLATNRVPALPLAPRKRRPKPNPDQATRDLALDAF